MLTKSVPRNWGICALNMSLQPPASVPSAVYPSAYAMLTSVSAWVVVAGQGPLHAVSACLRPASFPALWWAPLNRCCSIVQPDSSQSNASLKHGATQVQSSTNSMKPICWLCCSICWTLQQFAQGATCTDAHRGRHSLPRLSCNMPTLCQPTSVASTPGIRIACWLLITVQAEWGDCDRGCLPQRRLQDMHSRAGHCRVRALLL